MQQTEVRGARIGLEIQELHTGDLCITANFASVAVLPQPHGANIDVPDLRRKRC